MIAPRTEVGRKRHPDMCAGRSHRPVHEGEVAIHATRQERGILVIRLHGEPQPLERDEVLGQGERHAGAALAERRERHGIGAQFLDEGDAGILDSPELLWMVLRIREQRRHGIDDPAVHAIRRACRAQMRVPATILDAAEQQRCTVRESRRTGIEHGVDCVRPVACGEDRIAFVPVKQRGISCGTAHVSTGDCGRVETRASCAARISRSACRNEIVDSAP